MGDMEVYTPINYLYLIWLVFKKCHCCYAHMHCCLVCILLLNVVFKNHTTLLLQSPT